MNIHIGNIIINKNKLVEENIIMRIMQEELGWRSTECMRLHFLYLLSEIGKRSGSGYAAHCSVAFLSWRTSDFNETAISKYALIKLRLFDWVTCSLAFTHCTVLLHAQRLPRHWHWDSEKAISFVLCACVCTALRRAELENIAADVFE